MATFGEKLRSIRSERNMTQDDLASLLHTTKQVISNYERDARSPKLNIAVRYSEALNVPLSYLINQGINVVPHPETLLEEENTPSANKNFGFDNFTYAMQNETKELTESDKALLLSMARQLNEARKQKDEKPE